MMKWILKFLARWFLAIVCPEQVLLGVILLFSCAGDTGDLLLWEGCYYLIVAFLRAVYWTETGHVRFLIDPSIFALDEEEEESFY